MRHVTYEILLGYTNDTEQALQGLLSLIFYGGTHRRLKEQSEKH